MQTRETVELSQVPVVKANTNRRMWCSKTNHNNNKLSIAFLSVQMLQDMIANSTRAKYQPPKFHQFDEKGVPHFVEIWENIGSRGNQVVGQFIQSLKENAFEDVYQGLFYILQGIKPRTFEELAPHAHDMELSIANWGTKGFLVFEVKKDKKEKKGFEKMVKSNVKESMVANTTSLKFFKRKEVRAGKKDDGGKRHRLTLK
ncbi:retrotransposon protein putative ty3-gypsy sub-class [Cucumis melo var. makuwa]|uniref:Retrotransposon protein putative ty3-gypsy sub-class n=1 Tax=Cucumis melo var. makuwa TaxID=1194695 RepID=A0A5D3CAN8_CUCMM|nr:retrotransposon protein putative ty3-gypsy sub-class [Cucumis melo var. makuwa]TYK08362.1 retrotransposon protein putative ty3-gypsy sub-class [Cucumis melo var. makuwa]